ncbi:hypothetical protein HBI56_189590 [Parastagonospora nodorum]|uniref:Uncharacterized protein n=1 Tax=Phaeosphaeria nodorum (strain SN15 / ATCC MYA-4574 / FGSC 10173) TaxID=321614 RepID=A0A7U2FE93_PHANO|nr:hypothetical protein HBH56_144870 [Parastagonospora nodorum]QRD01375.1 hypothetical protein JI435_439310 [Parastagonospora nodorum SN15]KAH3927846.1 hypothetical protein HBH54_150060 [Parastagonospora nodorum]KAH3947980.1 hypothetical protein HBH53_110100 [Parastagonospora nodorum]KAH3960219.1 hypothetical protein HBH51_193920 [Parastagonospora nodorum]
MVTEVQRSLAGSSSRAHSIHEKKIPSIYGELRLQGRDVRTYCSTPRLLPLLLGQQAHAPMPRSGQESPQTQSILPPTSNNRTAPECSVELNAVEAISFIRGVNHLGSRKDRGNVTQHGYRPDSAIPDI